MCFLTVNSNVSRVAASRLPLAPVDGTVRVFGGFQVTAGGCGGAPVHAAAGRPGAAVREPADRPPRPGSISTAAQRQGAVLKQLQRIWRHNESRRSHVVCEQTMTRWSPCGQEEDHKRKKTKTHDVNICEKNATKKKNVPTKTNQNYVCVLPIINPQYVTFFYFENYL